jgi:hypothetical protein
MCSVRPRPAELREFAAIGIAPHRTVSKYLEKWCPGAGSNHRHCDFQSHALPTELPGHRRMWRNAHNGTEVRAIVTRPRNCPEPFAKKWCRRGAGEKSQSSASSLSSPILGSSLRWRSFSFSVPWDSEAYGHCWQALPQLHDRRRQPVDFGAVVADIEDRQFQFIADALDHAQYLLAARGVERSQGLIHQQEACAAQ